VDADRCELCNRWQPTTFHHLIPRAVHRKRRYLTAYGKREMRSRGLNICWLSHNGIHDIIPDEKELARSYTTKADLLAHAGIARHVAWVSKQK
jgi:hypothetical protein